jgi:hypothetical protein
MATNHTETAAQSDMLAIKHLWPHVKTRSNVTTEQAIIQAEEGYISVSTTLENAVTSVNRKLKRSTKVGMDLSDGSEIKFITARHRNNGQEYNGTKYKSIKAKLNTTALKNKTGALRICILHIDRYGNDTMRFFVIPFPIWQQRMNKSGISITFSRRDDSKFTPTAEYKWAEFEVKNIKQFSACL